MARSLGKHSKKAKSAADVQQVASAEQHSTDSTREPLGDKNPENDITKTFKPIEIDAAASASADAVKTKPQAKPQAKPVAKPKASAQVVAPKSKSLRETAAEAARRVQKSKRTRRILIFAAVLVVGALVAVGFYVHSLLSPDNAYNAAKEKFYGGVDLVQSADETVVALDEAVEGQITEENLEDRKKLLDDVPSADSDLSDAQDIFKSVEDTLSGHPEGDVIDDLETSASARRDMLNYGSQLVSYDIATEQASTAFTEAWKLIVDADSKSRQANALVANTNTENVTSSRDLNKTAIDDLNSASTKLQEVSGYLPEADLTSITDYMAAKGIALAAALASDEAYLAGNIDESNAQTETYNTENDRAAQLAAAIPSDPSQIVLDAYDNATSSLRDSYYEARSKAADADVSVREFLGVNEVVQDDASVTGQSQTTQAQTQSEPSQTTQS